EVAFATGAELVPEIERCGLDTWQVGPSRAKVDAWVRAAHPNLEQLPVEQRTRVAAPVLFIGSAAKRAVELVPRAQQWKPEIVVHDETELAGALHSLLLPHCTLVVSHGGASIMPSALAHGLPQLILPQG